MGNAQEIQRVADLIQLAVAPIFLLTAVAATLTVLTQRLSRIVDRGRALEAAAIGSGIDFSKELVVLESRAKLIYRALSLGVSAAILISALMTLAFSGVVFGFQAAKAIAFAFVAALFAYTGALLCLLREVFLALGSFRLGLHAAAPAKGSQPS